MTTIGVLGLGAVGARAARRLVTSGHRVIIADLKEPLGRTIAADLGVRAVEPDVVLHDADVVVVATPAPHHPIVVELIRRGVHVVSVSDDLADTEALVANAAHARQVGVALVVGVATSPGLSGLLARHLAALLDDVDEIHVAAHGTGGPSCARQHHSALAGTSLIWHDDEWVRRQGGSGRELFWFPEPIGAYDCYRAEMADPLLLQLAFPEVSRISARLSATRRDRFTARLPMLAPPHSEGGLGGLRVEVRGRRGDGRVTLVAGVAERTSVVAGAVAAAVAAAIAGGDVDPGLHALGATSLPNAALLDAVAAAGVTLQEYVGTDV
jgi:saccharopine dehydrogenase-like NADP-dependent oxidoreductase